MKNKIVLFFLLNSIIVASTLAVIDGGEEKQASEVLERQQKIREAHSSIQQVLNNWKQQELNRLNSWDGGVIETMKTHRKMCVGALCFNLGMGGLLTFTLNMIGFFGK